MITVDRKGNLRILLICVGPSPCNGTSSVITAQKMRLRPSTARRTFSLGGRSFSFPAGTSATLRVRMQSNLYKLLVRRKTFLLRITARISDSGGQRVSTRRVRVRASKAALREAARKKREALRKKREAERKRDSARTPAATEPTTEKPSKTPTSRPSVAL
jgi:hypothetical protein